MNPREVTVPELLKDIAGRPGSRVPAGTIRATVRDDPTMVLERPLSFYPERVFFYLGLAYGFCNLTGSISERFRASDGDSNGIRQHLFDHALVDLPWFPKWKESTACRVLHSMPAGKDQVDFFDFINSQLIVDRKRSVVWKIGTNPVKIPDPVMLDSRVPPENADIVVFIPFQHNAGFEITQKSTMFPTTPDVLRMSREDPEFETIAKAELCRPQ
jgi:hypothetical protein